METANQKKKDCLQECTPGIELKGTRVDLMKCVKDWGNMDNSDLLFFKLFCGLVNFF